MHDSLVNKDGVTLSNFQHIQPATVAQSIRMGKEFNLRQGILSKILCKFDIELPDD